MFLKFKGAVFAYNFFKKISASIIKVFFAVIKNPMFTVFCKLVFFTAAVVIVNPNILVPFYQKLFFYDSVVNSFDFFYHSALLYFSSLTAVFSDILQLKALMDSLHRRVNELTAYGTNFSKTLGEAIQSLTELFSVTSSIQNSVSILTRNFELGKNVFVRCIGELFSLTSSIQNSVSILTRDLQSTKHKFTILISDLFSTTSSLKSTIVSLTRDLISVREELSKTNASLLDLNTRFIQHRVQSAARFSAMQKILENVKAPIVGTSTATQILSSKTVSNIRPR